MRDPLYPLRPLPPDPVRDAFLALVQAEISVPRADRLLDYHVPRILRELRDRVRYDGWPQTFDDRLRLSLLPYIRHAAGEAGLDWTQPGAVPGPLGPLFEIDVRARCEGRGRAALPAAEFASYVAESRALLEEHTAARARAHNGEE